MSFALFLIYATILSFSLTSGIATLTRRDICFFRCYPVYAERRKIKMAEYQHFDGETYITFNIVYTTEKEVRLAVTNRGRISVLTYDLYEDENGNILN